MSGSPLVLTCRGCGTVVDPLDPNGPAPWACPRRGEGDVDHVLVVPLPDADDEVDSSSTSSFIRHRGGLAAYQAARLIGMGDAELVDLIGTLDAAVSVVEGHGFDVTPCASWPALASAVGVGELWAKDETGNVAGSHKGRHLMGLAIWLELRAAIGASDPQRLAIASCGNAALAAATVARAIDRPIEVFVPTWADPSIVGRLQELGATVVTCERLPDHAGDPCVARFRSVVAEGAVPFGCTGPDNGLTIDGGRTIGWELAEQAPGLTRVDVQVGGGALGTSLGDGLRSSGAVDVPRVDAVQTEGGAPFDRAFRHASDVGLADAVTHRGASMWPWETEPHSAATGILDDETYDWAGLSDVLLETGGNSIVAAEADIERAAALVGEHIGDHVDATGSAGLAGILTLPGDESTRLGILLTGRRRSRRPLEPQTEIGA